MKLMILFLKPVVTVALIAAAQPVFAQDPPDLETLLSELASPDTTNWQALEQRIIAQWSRSGSDAMDLLLERAQDAMEAEEFDKAIEHLTALTDHAPDFAEGWNMRATVFFQQGEFGLAVADISQALALNPRHFGALTGLALILQELGYSERALEAWRALKAIHPHRPHLNEAIERLEKETEGDAL